MNKKVIIAIAVGVALLGVVGLTLLLLSEQQDPRSRAGEVEQLTLPTQPPAQTQQACPAPGQVQGVLVEFPECTGDICNFTQASCSWGSVAGATKYKLVVTEVETGTSVKNEEVEASITRNVFSVNQNKTYKCDVSAVNSCGESGAAGSHSLFCEVDALVEATPPPPVPTTPPVIAKNICGLPCTTNDNCQSGLTCSVGSSGQGYCAIPAYSAACQSSPSTSACCSAPTSPPQPTLPPTGIVSDSLILGVGSVLLLIVGAAFLFIL